MVHTIPKYLTMKRIKVKGKSVLVFNQTPCHGNTWRSGGIAPCILDLGATYIYMSGSLRVQVALSIVGLHNGWEAGWAPQPVWTLQCAAAMKTFCAPVVNVNPILLSSFP